MSERRYDAWLVVSFFDGVLVTLQFAVDDFLLAVVVLDGWVSFLDGNLARDCLAMAGDLTISRVVRGLVLVLFEVFTCGKEAQLSVGELVVSVFL